jgi:hypothetical protein
MGRSPVYELRRTIMTFTEAAAEVLRLVGKPLHYKDITEIAIQKNLLSHVGKSPDVTMGSRLAALLKKGPKENPLVRVKPGIFALRAWEEGGPPGPAPDADAAFAAAAARATESAAVAEGEPETEAEPEVVVAPPAESKAPRAPDEQMRADLAAGASEIFDEEEDDDQPILGGAEPPADAAGGRRRRRRRRGRGADAPAPRADDGLPTYTVSPAFDGAAPEVAALEDGAPRAEGAEPAPREHREHREPREPREHRDRRGNEPREARGDRGADRGGERSNEDRGRPHEGPPSDIEDVAGRELADVVVWLLNGFDRNGGPVSLRALADAALRRQRLSGDAGLITSQIAAAARADNARRAADGRRPRFRFAGGRVALTDWALPPDVIRLEQEALAAVERYRDGARRALAKRITDLPGNGFAELSIAVLERLGISQLKPVRRPGGNGGELYLAGVQRVGGGETRVAVIVRKDGREIGRERVTEARGSLHHFGLASAAWMLTSGQVLSGAREEASAPGALPVTLLDGAGVAKACEEHGIGVVRTVIPVLMPDADLFDGLRGA